MANETIFTTKASEYANSRPSYAKKAIDKILSELLKEGDLIADIGSGTGIFSKEFLSRGYEVYCVEPNEAMRKEAESAHGNNQLFHSVAASAENTSLTSGSISLVTAASAFHWFDTKAFYTECKRILKPDGYVCLLANRRKYDEFTKAQHAICERCCQNFTSLSHGTDKMLRLADEFFQGGYHTGVFEFPLTYTKKKFVSRSLSSSYAPEKNTKAYEEYVRALQGLLEEYSSEEVITVANETVMLWGKLI